MEAQKSDIERALAILFQPGDTIELRAVGGRQTISGFYRDFGKLAADAEQLSNQLRENVYVCLNPVRPELYARQADSFAPAKRGGSASDADIPSRRWLLIDLDAIRPAGVSATDQQKQAAIALGRRVYAYLQDRLGGACLVCGDSGNGAHILLRLADLPADEQTRWICERLLQLLAEQFTGDHAKVDRSTFNAARICKLYGTVARKGSDIPEQPHRLSRLLHVPDPLQPVTLDQLLAITGQAEQRQQAAPQNGNGSGWDIDRLLEQRQLEYSRDDSYRTASGETAVRWQLECCPWEPEHQRSAWLIQFPSGAVAAGCLGDRCSGKGWQELRQLWQLPDSGADLQAAVLASLQRQPSAVAVQPQELLIVRSLDVQPEQVAWLWQDRLVVGGINLCAGRGGIGKTFFLCDLVARITNNTLTAPNGQPLLHGRVLYSTGEDHVAKVVEPRMQQHAVDRNRLEYIKGLPAGEYVQLLDVIAHCNLLRDAIRQRPDTVALVLDPISSFQGDTDSNKVASVRRFTAVLTQLAEEFNLAVLGIHHFAKAKREAAGDAISGSHAYRDAARSIWLFALDANEPTRRLMVCDKHNWAAERPGGLAYRIEQGRLVYEPEPLDMSADELMTQSTQQSLDIACAWLLAQLSAGPQPAINVQVSATTEGIAERTLNRAKKRLGVVSIKQKDGWLWQLHAKSASNP